MAVPEEIRQVPRPKNTIVDDNGKDTPLRYAVRERAGITCVPGCNPRPKNGKVIGHIIEGNFVPITEPTKPDKPFALEYGAAALIHSVSGDIYADLLDVYPPADAAKIMAMASLRVIHSRTSDQSLSFWYRSSFVCEYFPGVSLSKNTVCTFQQAVGENLEKREQFYLKRIAEVLEEHHVAIDGTLKENTSRINDLSGFSRKARVKGCKDISVLYAYDIEKMEPICAEVFPGNCIDATSYTSFVREHHLTRGIIVADKGFPPTSISAELEANPELHFLTPLKRNDSRIANHNMYKFQGVLKGVGKEVYYKKCRIQGKGNSVRYLYSFLDVNQEFSELNSYAAKAEKDSSKYNEDQFDKKRDTLGTIVFESDQDLSPEVAYSCYSDRWKLELVMKQYKSDEGLDTTSVHGDFAVYGSEFINFVATLITCRIMNRARDAHILEDMSYGTMMDRLRTSWRFTNAPDPMAIPMSNDEYWVHTLENGFELLELLGLSKPEPKPEPVKRGRPKKAPTEKKTTSAPKKRGRPPKTASHAESETAPAPDKQGHTNPGAAQPEEKTTVEPQQVPKKRGRPPKTSTEPADTPSAGSAPEPKKRGRPRKETPHVESEAALAPDKQDHRDPGKVQTEEKSADESSQGPRKRGRPRKAPVAAENMQPSESVPVPRKRGRPRKVVTESEVQPAPKKRGRPRKQVTESGPDSDSNQT